LKYHYVVFGAGRQGTAAVHDLLLFCDAASVLVVEPDDERRKAAQARIQKLLPRQASKLEWISVATVADLKGAHVVLSCAPYTANVALTELALEAGVPFTDLGGNPETVAAQERLAAGKRVPVVPDCGISPGISNIIAMHCARAHGCTRIEVRCGGLPLEEPGHASNPLGYKLVFSPAGLLSEYSGSVPVIREGRVRQIAALSAIEHFDAEHEAAPTSNNSPQVVRQLAAAGVTHYDYMTLRYKGHWQLVRGWRSLGFLKGDAQRDGQLAERLAADKALRYDPKKDRDKLILRVRGWRNEHGMQRGYEYRLDVVADKQTKFAAMELATAWGITIVAHHIASGRGRPKGFATPERFVDSGWVISQVERRLAGLKS
jgi:saccharopine dehydrogenase-like NADP-dependent oxidoreductase